MRPVGVHAIAPPSAVVPIHKLHRSARSHAAVAARRYCSRKGHTSAGCNAGQTRRHRSRSRGLRDRDR